MRGKTLKVEQLERRELLAANPLCGPRAEPVQAHDCVQAQECGAEAPGPVQEQQRGSSCEAAQEQTRQQLRQQAQDQTQDQTQEQPCDQTQQQTRLRTRIQMKLQTPVGRHLRTQLQDQTQAQDGDCDRDRLRDRDRDGDQDRDRDRDGPYVDAALESLAPAVEGDPLQLRDGYGAGDDDPNDNGNFIQKRDRTSCPIP